MERRKRALKYLPTTFRDSSTRLIDEIIQKIDAIDLREKPQFVEFMTAISILHLASVNKKKSTQGRMSYTSVYPHEVAMLDFATQFGYRFILRDKQSI